ncbi:hypothetical protein [Motiliproteus sediminis]|uniref:hypothetical protein n=1 Tax=Motiliproteus sediminis TaxID=1468178 RepID=UPI001AF01B30|nr:hypothetical protein [Motiliproteus sediminis]
MPAPSPDILLNRIDALTGQLNPSVARSDGAAFALALSMIFHAQQSVQGIAAVESDGSGVAAGRERLYSPEIVGRLGRALQAGARGEMAMLVSWLEEAPLPPLAAESRQQRDGGGLSLAQAAVLAKSYSLLEEIQQSSLSVAA